MTRRLQALLQRHWWRASPSWLSRLMVPLAWLYGVLAARHRQQGLARRYALPNLLPAPVIVVGNFVLGGAGKTPTVIALAQALQQAGWHPGVVSRGFGRADDGVRDVQAGDEATAVGDEPLLIRRRTGLPVFVGRDRVAAARALIAVHPDVDVVLSDDGLQHHVLPRRAALVVFDERGAGNGMLLPAGPLREVLPRQLPADMCVLYTAGIASTPLPGALAERHITHAWPLAAWHRGDASQAEPLQALRGRRLLAVAGLAAPEKFFSMLEEAGLHIARLPLPDHHGYAALPWPANTPDVITTEKDAVKLAGLPVGATRVWVVPLDLALPAALIGQLTQLLTRLADAAVSSPSSPPPP